MKFGVECKSSDIISVAKQQFSKGVLTMREKAKKYTKLKAMSIASTLTLTAPLAGKQQIIRI